MQLQRSKVHDVWLHVSQAHTVRLLFLKMLVLPSCLQPASSGVFRDVEALLSSEAFPALATLAALAQAALPCICDVKDAGDGMLFFRLSPDKVWASWQHTCLRLQLDGSSGAVPRG